MTQTIKKGRWQATPKTTDTRNSTLFALRLKALLVGLASHEATPLAMLTLILWGALS